MNYFFENNIGSISFKKVFIEKIKEEFNFINIAYIEIKTKKSFINLTKFYIRIIFTNATLKDIPLKKVEIKDARDFEIKFLYARLQNNEFE